jgi:PAS domain S-box-containing protein
LKRKDGQAYTEIAERFRDFAEIASDWVWETDADIRFIWMSQDIENTTGIPNSYYLGKTIEEIDPPVENPEIWARHILDLRSHLPINDFSLWRTTPEGERRCLSVSAKPLFDPDGKFTGYRGITRDITVQKYAEDALRDSEERYRSLYNLTPAMMHSIDLDGRLLNVTDHWLQTLGYERDEVIGRRSTEFVTEESARRATEEFLPQLFETGSLNDIPYRLVTKEGAFIDVILSAVMQKDANGKFVNSLSLMIDVTKQKEAERQLRQSQKMEAVGQLTGGIAHEFNNLLMVIVGNLELSLDRLADSSARRFISTAIKGAMRGAELTRQLLAFSRKQDLLAESINLNLLIKNMDDLLQRTLGERIFVNAALAGEVWPVLVDRSLLESVLLNLLLNARDAMPTGGEIGITTSNQFVDGRFLIEHPHITAGEFVMLEVADTGCGIAPETLVHVFEPFFTTKDVGQGTGLGLSMILGFTEQSGGFVDIESELGQGTRVRVYLPRAANEPAALDSGDTGNSNNMKFSPVTATVLVVEDDPGVRKIVVELLAELGCAIIEAGDGMTALSQIDDHRDIDMIFTDIVLPGGLSGIEIVDQARLKNPNLKTILTSGYPEGEIVGWTGAEHPWFIRKPYRKTELADMLNQVLDA